MRRSPLLLSILILAGGVAAAQPSRDDNARALAQAKQEAEQAARRSDRLEREARRASSQAQRARARSEALTARIEAAEAGLTAAERRIALIQGLQAEHERRLAERQQPLARLTGALQIMARRPAALALVQPGCIAKSYPLAAPKPMLTFTVSPGLLNVTGATLQVTTLLQPPVLEENERV